MPRSFTVRLFLVLAALGLRVPTARAHEVPQRVNVVLLVRFSGIACGKPHNLALDVPLSKRGCPPHSARRNGQKLERSILQQNLTAQVF